MKILHILEAAHGGTARHVLDLLPALQARGEECDLVYSPLRHAAFSRKAADLSKCGVGVFALEMARGWGGRRDAAALMILVRRLRAHRYDVVHCHSTKAGMLGRLAVLAAASNTPRRSSTPVIYTPHCVAFDTVLPRPQRRAARYLEQLLAPLTSHYITVARHEYRSLQRAGLLKHRRADVIYNGVDLQDFDSLTNNHPIIPTHQTVACFGRLTPQKNQAALLRVWPEVLGAVPGARLVFVGGGEDEAKLRVLAARLKVEGSTKFLGECEEARDLYRNFAVVAQPSRWEGCPYSILEAMAARRAIVASRVGGVPELLEGAGELLHSSDDGLARQIIELLENQTRREELGASARRRVEEKFRLETMVEKTLAVYRQAKN